MAFLPEFFRPKHGAGDAGAGGQAAGASPGTSTETAKGEESLAGERTGAAIRPEGAAGSGETDPLPSGKLVLLLDDVLSRVPTRSLKPGLHDPSRELHFDLDELIEGITGGRPCISLAKLAERYPDTFEAPANEAEEASIGLPLQKLIQQVGRASRRGVGAVVGEAETIAPPVEHAPPQSPSPEEPALDVPAPLHPERTARPLRRLDVMSSAESKLEGRVGIEPTEVERPLTTSTTADESREPFPENLRVSALLADAIHRAKMRAEARDAVVPTEVEAANVIPQEIPPPKPVEQVAPGPISASPRKADPPPLSTQTPPGVESAVQGHPVQPQAPFRPAPAPPIAPPEPVQPKSEDPVQRAAPTISEPQFHGMRISALRPNIRPPSIHGPSGLVVPEPATPLPPPVPGFVFAPRPSPNATGIPSAPAEPAEPMTDLAEEVPIPPLFFARAVPAEPAVAPETEIEESAPSVSPAATPSEAGEAEKTAGENGKSEMRDVASEEESSAEEARQKRQIAHHPRKDAASRGSDLLGIYFSLPLIDQEPLQAIFMTEEFLDLVRVSQLSCGFPGVTGCLIVAGDAQAYGGERPAGLDGPALCRLTKQLSETAAAYPEELPAVQTYTLHTGNRALSIFARQYVAMCVVHSHRGFLPGVRERLAAVADTLSRGLSGEAEPE